MLQNVQSERGTPDTTYQEGLMMASKRRIRRKSCEGKVKHDTLDAAYAAKRGSGHGGVQPYKCKFCGKFHLGHTPNKVKRAIKARKREKL